MDAQEKIETLRAARELVAQGWCQGDASKTTNGVEDRWCAVGALNKVLWTQGNDLSVSASATDLAIRDEVYLLLQVKLPEKHKADFRGVATFNDDEETTQQDVLDLYDKALADLGGLG